MNNGLGTGNSKQTSCSSSSNDSSDGPGRVTPGNCPIHPGHPARTGLFYHIIPGVWVIFPRRDPG